MLLYLHGFNSSPESKKALQTRDWCAEKAPDLTFVCPALPPFAEPAMDILRSLIEQQLPESVYLIGSSMGGFFATCLAEQYNLRAVLINPAVSPGRASLPSFPFLPSHACITLKGVGFLLAYHSDAGQNEGTFSSRMTIATSR